MKTEFGQWLYESLGAGAAGSPSILRIGPPLAAWEDQFLMRGLHEELFTIDDCGLVTSELLQTEPGKVYRIMSHEPARLLRENICQLATAARLIFERGWLRRHLSLEPGREEHHATADQWDLLVRSAAGDILVWVEVRRTAAELNKLVSDLRACSRRGPHAHADCGFPQNHPRHEFCVSTQPANLWLVAPDGDLALSVTCDGHSVELEPLPSLPHRSRFELG